MKTALAIVCAALFCGALASGVVRIVNALSECPEIRSIENGLIELDRRMKALEADRPMDPLAPVTGFIIDLEQMAQRADSEGRTGAARVLRVLGDAELRGLSPSLAAVCEDVDRAVVSKARKPKRE